tara:strand:- start:1512 stop:4586 length:3075 start_codon:yes stop_codon:yes gene_type:complete
MPLQRGSGYTRKAPARAAIGLAARQIKNLRALSERALEANIVIAITLHNQGKQLLAALESATSQSLFISGEACIVILDDQSTDDWQALCGSSLDHPGIVVLNGYCGSAARARNGLLDYVDAHLPNAEWVARLDADDTFATDYSLEGMAGAGRKAGSQYVIGSNHLRIGPVTLPRTNIADKSVLLNREKLLRFIQAFCFGHQEQELPSCNLLIRTKSNIRYPDIHSAEDHWLVASLLVFRPHDGAVVSAPVYCSYSLSGQTTNHNRSNNEWTRQRVQLGQAVERWVLALNQGAQLLGHGLEGIVTLDDRTVVKNFYPWRLDESAANELAGLLAHAPASIAPSLEWSRAGNGDQRCSYQWSDLREISTQLQEDQVSIFLTDCFTAGLVVSNISRSNLRLSADGRLVNIDIGSDIVPFTVSRFLDSAARLYAICVLGYSDQELARRNSVVPQHRCLREIPGFERFYGDLVHSLYDMQTSAERLDPAYSDNDTTLLIKACAQDAETLRSQVEHIVSQLCYPAKFKRICLAIDTFEGPYLREYSSGSLEGVLAVSEQLKTEKIIDQVLVSPCTSDSIRDVYLSWFGYGSIMETHTNGQAPLYSQLWAFNQIDSRFVLQCDCDVLIGRQDFTHDYLADMKHACEGANVISVGFNIPQSQAGFKPYRAPAGGYVPEVRFCLMDLTTVFDQLPIRNPHSGGRFNLMWHRALELHQEKTNLTSLRGGDSRSFYIHPQNRDKKLIDLPMLQDLIAQGVIPKAQQDQYDLVPEAGWEYPRRLESIVFLLKGKNTPPEKLQRCLDSLRKQSSQAFGIILIEDGGSPELKWRLPLMLGELSERATLIRREERYGYIPNFNDAIENICGNPDSLIVVLDQDDALMSHNLVERLQTEIDSGTDLINGAMFRPNKPAQLYSPTYENPRQNGGGNVWAHMRAFRKSLFEQVPKRYFVDGKGAWIDAVTDYATMLPMSEIAKRPVHIDDMYCYYHEREEYSVARREQSFSLLKAVFDKPSLRNLLKSQAVQAATSLTSADTT